MHNKESITRELAVCLRHLQEFYQMARLCADSLQSSSLTLTEQHAIKPDVQRLNSLIEEPAFKHCDENIQFEALWQRTYLSLLLEQKAFFLVQAKNLLEELERTPKDRAASSLNALERGRRKAVLRLKIEQNRQPLFSIQVPSEGDCQGMQGMPAGNEDSQYERISKLKMIAMEQADIAIQQTSLWEELIDIEYHEQWQVCFDSIRSGSYQQALDAFTSIPTRCLMKKALLRVHEEAYIQDIIRLAAQAARGKFSDEYDDIVVTAKSFEIMMKDLFVSVHNENRVQVNLSLPSHHAYSDKASGFCIFNKMAILMAYQQSHSTFDMQALFIGLDVNRDDGLSQILMQDSAFAASRTYHLDVFDSRVYPWQGKDDISAMLGREPEAFEKAWSWTAEQHRYDVLDLSTLQRERDEIHPAMQWVVRQLKDQAYVAQKRNYKLAIYVPLGWDSHTNETAACGKWLNQCRMMSKKMSQSMRFNDVDFDYFYQSLSQVYHQFSDNICQIYIGLEGGYTDEVNFRQLRLLTQTLKKNLTAIDKSSISWMSFYSERQKSERDAGEYQACSPLPIMNSLS